MDISLVIAEKTLPQKEKIKMIGDEIIKKNLDVDAIIQHAKNSKDTIKATCIEAIEYSSKLNPSIVNKQCFDFVIDSLMSKAPRVKWESAKVIGNSAHLFSYDLEEAIKNLLTNTEDKGTVVRWSAAFALGEIVKIKTNYQIDLIKAIEVIIDKEEKNSIKKIYQKALKQLK